MASAKTPTSRTKLSAKDTPAKPAPLIPKDNEYRYKPSPMATAANEIARIARSKKSKIEVPQTQYSTIKLVHSLCSAANANAWSPECEKALVEHLPLREHHKAFLSHNMFVTMIGAVVARALEQATRNCKDTLDLLADRYYVRSIACHDSSKTSTVEAAAYSGIMALHMELEARSLCADKRAKLNKRYGCTQSPDEVKIGSQTDQSNDFDALKTAMANFGFKHHYENNPHHPEHFLGDEMDDMNLVEAIVDGLACIFERNKNHTNVHSWLNMYNVDRFKDHNKSLAGTIMTALDLYITDADYTALKTFRDAIFSIIGESIPWSRVMMTECCNRKTDTDITAPLHDYASCFVMKK